MPRRRDVDAYAYRRARAQLLAHSDVCALCGHAGATTADHDIPVSRGGTHGLDNLVPAHGTEGCPVCGRCCNQEKGDKTLTEFRAGRLNTSVDWYAGPEANGL
ncbi:HNH endonuclease [Streptomyces sp. CAI-85]|uniref:HNH endonuclease n=1 Tax=Streptomyces sp. CAI-85 TaxID=1472662 RepID=UPI001587590B|nr:HNH endonuclease [Streptomyces sp. CAI-85]NUV63246.1 HNH endonuclease [Streptomyces sp. CAI-85]